MFINQYFKETIVMHRNRNYNTIGVCDRFMKFSFVLFPLYRSSGVTHNKLWYAALALVTLVLFSVAVGALVFMVIYYTHPQACFLNKVFLGLNSGLCIIVSLLAISPCIQTCESVRLRSLVSPFLYSAVQQIARLNRRGPAV